MHDISSTPLPRLAERAADSHKGDYGRVLIVGGSRGMAGAPALAGMAALRSGAGLVTLAVPRSVQATVAGFEPSLMTRGLGSDAQDGLSINELDAVLEIAQGMSVVAIGPGLGLSAEAQTAELVRKLYAEISVPMIVDADGLNALAQAPECLASPGGERVLTPHPGEFQRLTSESGTGEAVERADRAAALAKRDPQGQTIVVLKGTATIVTDGNQYLVNTTGNPGMATGGAGDCLTGVIAALVGQGLSVLDAARLGVHVHGLAGDLAAAEQGEVSLIASDLVKFLSASFRSLQPE